MSHPSGDDVHEMIVKSTVGNHRSPKFVPAHLWLCFCRARQPDPIPPPDDEAKEKRDITRNSKPVDILTESRPKDREILKEPSRSFVLLSCKRNTFLAFANHHSEAHELLDSEV
ncbi:MAG: hypothetical protein M1820_008695 [Bogoriella megaspora]|nr:MAG: hypothetical protein M1820_008695 [Bogoriella megaspora]